MSMVKTSGSGERCPVEYRPAIVVIEYNAGLDREASLAEPLGVDPLYTSAFGASLGALDTVARDKGYRRVHTEMAGVNAFFVRDDLSDAAEPIRGIADRSPELRFTRRRTRL